METTCANIHVTAHLTDRLHRHPFSDTLPDVLQPTPFLGYATRRSSTDPNAPRSYPLDHSRRSRAAGIPVTSYSNKVRDKVRDKVNSRVACAPNRALLRHYAVRHSMFCGSNGLWAEPTLDTLSGRREPRRERLTIGILSTRRPFSSPVLVKPISPPRSYPYRVFAAQPRGNASVSGVRPYSDRMPELHISSWTGFLGAVFFLLHDTYV